MKLFGKIVLAAVAVTSVIAFSSCSQETPVAAYQYKATSTAGATGEENTLVFYGDEKEGSFAISTAELKFNDKNSHDRRNTTIYILDAEGKRVDDADHKLENQLTEVTVPSYAIMKGKYTIEDDGNGGKTLTLSNVECLKDATDGTTDLEGTYSGWDSLLGADPLEWETSKTKDQLENDAKKNGYITKKDESTFVIKKTVVVSEYGKYVANDNITSGTIDPSSGEITIGNFTFDEII